MIWSELTQACYQAFLQNHPDGRMSRYCVFGTLSSNDGVFMCMFMCTIHTSWGRPLPAKIDDFSEKLRTAFGNHRFNFQPKKKGVNFFLQSRTRRGGGCEGFVSNATKNYPKCFFSLHISLIHPLWRAEVSLSSDCYPTFSKSRHYSPLGLSFVKWSNCAIPPPVLKDLRDLFSSTNHDIQIFSVICHLCYIIFWYYDCDQGPWSDHLWFRLYDANGDGFIEFREYMPVGLSHNQIERKNEWKGDCTKLEVKEN